MIPESPALCANAMQSDWVAIGDLAAHLGRTTYSLAVWIERHNARNPESPVLRAWGKVHKPTFVPAWDDEIKRMTFRAGRRRRY